VTGWKFQQLKVTFYTNIGHILVEDPGTNKTNKQNKQTNISQERRQSPELE